MMGRWMALVGAVCAGLLALALPSAACGCVEPMSTAQLNRLIAKAETGDMRAIGQVWSEYAHARGDSRAAAPWEKRAVRLGIPVVMDHLADDWMWAAQDERDTRRKRLYLIAAIRLLENGMQHRSTARGAMTLAGVDAYLYFNSLRSARAALRTLDQGVAGFEARAAKGDPGAAYHAATYYFWVRLDQGKREKWERLASSLGEPEFAGMHIGNRSKAGALRDIAKAQENRAFLATLGDAAVQAMVQQELKSRTMAVRQWSR
jgi:hypothetical protein